MEESICFESSFDRMNDRAVLDAALRGTLEPKVLQDHPKLLSTIFHLQSEDGQTEAYRPLLTFAGINEKVFEMTLAAGADPNSLMWTKHAGTKDFVMDAAIYYLVQLPTFSTRCLDIWLCRGGIRSWATQSILKRMREKGCNERLVALFDHIVGDEIHGLSISN